MHNKILAATIGDCIHTMSLMKYLSIAEELEFEANFIGSALSIDTIIREIEIWKPDIVVLSYRLTPSVARELFSELKSRLKGTQYDNLIFILGGTNPVLSEAQSFGLFKFMFSEVTPECSAIQFLNGGANNQTGSYTYQTDLVMRIEQSYPMPLIRHHFGLPSVEETIEGVRRIAESQVIDIISIGPDQNAQEHFFRPESMNPHSDGAGGVPLRKSTDLSDIYQASRCGNYPLVRCYAGTNDLTRWADMLAETIHVAWGAIPITWYSELDGRSSRPLVQAIKENQDAIAYYASKGIPVEINESHQWALRNTSDIIEVATAYIATYNAKNLGVKHYIMQYMLNTPPGISLEMDIAKMLAKIELIESLHDDNFTSYRMIRTGLASLSSDPDVAKGQLASSITISMALKPHIVHVVGFSEGDHLASPKDVIESCKIARGVISNCLNGLPNILEIPNIVQRRAEILRETKVLLDAIRDLSDGDTDPLLDPSLLARAIAIGFLDAPLLKGRTAAKGNLTTRLINGACQAVEPNSGEVLDEKNRLNLLSK
ncbi:methionine synthase [Methanoculleus sp. FWC-SCC1]|uniref:Methionine synthase n=1 Tax=Methanoculleus frigidifontis TaxID=2584085 RepID=A0ABT8MC17_9EURY|nr:hypothetical protein [Methanoculleus sp. FWC-SCC1]MDN7025476.1 methionine synthase [Methanoculleus sp. FWC-SCC1]